MSDYNWCHGPECHTYATQSRIRGAGRDKVLRTRRIKVHQSSFAMDNVYNYFCNQSCLFDYIKTHLQSIVAIAPRTKALETPIKVEKEKYESYRYDWGGNGATKRVPYQATRTTIKTVDNN
jgi:hypothetical protein|tara:strand:+ start:750 stop:1112 length:363 start_codon:yes stop_codon:yes gene_type:complete